MEMRRLTVATLEGMWTGEVDSWTSLVVLAALSAEPESLSELAAAVRRYQPEHQLFKLDQLTAQLPLPSPLPDPGRGWGRGDDRPWCWIDLVGRTVVAGQGFELPEPRGAYEVDENDQAEGFPIVWLDTPADWLFRQAGDDWRAMVAARRSGAAPRLDARAVLFGKPLLEFVADQVLRATANTPDQTGEGALARALHIQWLMTARDDLGGRTPRQVLLAERERLGSDMEHRQEQWSLQRHAAPGLASESPAYRFGGFGTIEVVLYFDLVRAVLDQACELTRQGTPRSLLVQRLAEFRDDWLNEPNETTGPAMTPAQLIESERRRMPVTSDGSHLHDDCPICRAQAEGEFGPAFLCFDGHHLELEDEFAFSLSETREEWEREQEEYRKFSAEMDRKARERAERGGDSADALGGSAWQTSFVDWEALPWSDSGPQQALLALAFPLAELTCDLQSPPEGAALLKSLNGAYSNLRASQDATARDSAAQEFRDLLEAVSGKYSDLTPKCADLQSRLDEVLRRIS
jgi:hypothetical protein